MSTPIEIKVTVEEPIILGASQTGGTVLSVNGKKGVVVLTAADVGAIGQSAIDAKVDKVTGKSLIADTEISRLAQMTEIFTTALKSAYDGAVAWIATNGTNILNHIGSTSNPHSTTYSQVGAEAANANIQGHIGTTGNPHGTTYSDVGAAASGHNHSGTYEPANSNIQNHISSTSNPHNVTASQIGALTSAGVSDLKDELKKTVTMAANEIDWSAGTHFICNSSGAVTLTETNLVSKKNFGIVLKIPNATSVSFPAGWVLKTGADTFGATSSIYALNENGTVVYTIRNNA